MTTAILEAFIEGRTTNVSYEDSQSRKNQIKLNAYIETLKDGSRATIKRRVAVDMLCSKTKRVIKQFDSKNDAVEFIINDILKQPEKEKYKVLAHLNMGLKLKWKAYGYLWRITSRKIKRQEITPKKFRYYVYHGNRIKRRFYTVDQTAKFLGIKPATLRDMLDHNRTFSKVFKNKNLTVEKVNDTPITITLKTKRELKAILNCSMDVLYKFLREGATRNNKTYIVEEMKKD